MKKGKKYSDSMKLIDRTKLYDPCLLYTSRCV